MVLVPPLFQRGFARTHHHTWLVWKRLSPIGSSSWPKVGGGLGGSTSLKEGVEGFRTHTIPVCSLCFMVMVQPWARSLTCHCRHDSLPQWILIPLEMQTQINVFFYKLPWVLYPSNRTVTNMSGTRQRLSSCLWGKHFEDVRTESSISRP